MKRLLVGLLFTVVTGVCSAQGLGPGKSSGNAAVIVSSYDNGQSSTTNWGCDGSTAKAGGAGNTYGITQTPGISSPSVSGASMALTATFPASGNNVLCWWKPGTADTGTWIRFATDVYLPSGLANNEFDPFIITPTLDAMFGTQCNRTSGYWQYANQTSMWYDGPIPCPGTLTTGVWHHLIFSDYWDPTDTSCGGFPTLHYGSITIDGVTSSWGGTTICATAIPSGWTHVYGCQFQMDSSTAATLTEYVDNVSCWVGK